MILAAVLLWGAAGSSAQLFADPATCTLSPEWAALASALASGQTADLPVPQGFEATSGQLVDRVAGDRTVTLPLRGEMMGLSVEAVAVTVWDGGDTPAVSWHFAAPFDEVLGRLNGAGFALDASGHKRREREDEVYVTEFALQGGDGRTASRFTCSWG